MATQIGKVSIEINRDVEIVKNVDNNGDIEAVPEKISLRFDFLVPLGTPYEVLHDVVKELGEIVKVMDENSKKQAEEAKSKKAKQEQKVDGEE